MLLAPPSVAPPAKRGFQALPEREQEYSQLASHGDDGPLFGFAGAFGCHLQALEAQGAVGSERPEDVLCRTDQQSAQISI